MGGEAELEVLVAGGAESGGCGEDEDASVFGDLGSGGDAGFGADEGLVGVFFAEMVDSVGGGSITSEENECVGVEVWRKGAFGESDDFAGSFFAVRRVGGVDNFYDVDAGEFFAEVASEDFTASAGVEDYKVDHVAIIACERMGCFFWWSGVYYIYV